MKDCDGNKLAVGDYATILVSNMMFNENEVVKVVSTTGGITISILAHPSARSRLRRVDMCPPYAVRKIDSVTAAQYVLEHGDPGDIE